MRWTSESKLLIGLVITFVLLLIFSVVAFMSAKVNIRASRAVEQSIQFTGGIESLYGIVRNLDIGARRFAYTNSRDSLSDFKEAQNMITPGLANEKEIFQADKKRLQFIETLERMIGSLSRTDEMLVRARLDDDTQKVKAIIADNDSESIVREIRSRIDSMEDAERILLHEQILAYDESTRSAVNTYLALSFIVLVFLLLIVGTAYRYILVIRKESEADKRVLREIVEHAPIGILTLSSDLTVTEVNPAFYANTGRRPQDTLNKKITEVIPELPKTAFLEAAEKGTAHQVDQLVISLTGQEGDNEKYWDITVWPMREASTIKGMIVLIVDVSEKVNLSNQREVFAQTLTHDMKTPLIAADRIYEAILDSRVGSMDSMMHELIDKLRKNNLDVLKMVKDVLEVSRYKQQSFVLNMEGSDILPAVNEAVTKLTPASEHRNIHIVVQIPSPVPLVWADRTALYHLVSNLVENAIKFSPMEGVVRISAEAKENTVVIHVEDSGPGMSDEEQKKLFKSSWQGELGKTAPSGTGLGLYLCQQIVKAHRGEISCQSKLGFGSVFSVELPKAPHIVHADRVLETPAGPDLGSSAPDIASDKNFDTNSPPTDEDRIAVSAPPDRLQNL